MDEKLVAALVGGGASLAVAILGQLFNPMAQRRLEKQKAELQSDIEATKALLSEQTGVRAARRDYEYEARKRLYTEVEPLFFQLYEGVEECYYRIASLARTSRKGHLGDNSDSWLSEDGYYLRSTAYKLILPPLIFRLIQQRMTFIDLRLDEVLRLRYLLLKNLFNSFVDHYEFAALQPALIYEPAWEDHGAQKRNPAVHRPQGFVTGDLENLTDQLLVREETRFRVCSFGEFENQVASKGCRIGELTSLYRGFAPSTHPVLARMLVAQAGLCKLLMSTYRARANGQMVREELDIYTKSKEVRRALQWKDADDSQGDFESVRHYLSECLDWIDAAP